MHLTERNPMSARFLHFFTAGALALGLVAHAGASTPTPEQLDGIKVVSAEQVQALMAKGTPVVDTRVPAEYAERTIKGAVSVPYKEKSAKEVTFDRTLDSFDLSRLPANKAAPIVFFCNAGECWKSYKASVVARDAGYKQIHWFRGGFPEWSLKGLPTR